MQTVKRRLPDGLRTWARTVRSLWNHWIDPVVPIAKTLTSLRAYPPYALAWYRYRRLAGAETLHIRDGYPCFLDNATPTSFDPHYFYQAVWATERIARLGAKQHVDVGSDVDYLGMLTSHLPVVALDLWPPKARLPGLQCACADIVNLPLATNSVESLSCLHVAEHIGLGRYGDRLDPQGTRRACSELARVLSPKGNLFFSLPVGRPRVSFNAHRVHSPAQVFEYFGGLSLVEFSVVDDAGNLRIGADPAQFVSAEYACGMFWFRRSGS